MNGVNLLSIEVQSDDSIGFYENERVQLLSWGSILEIVLHADFVKNWDIFHHNSFVKFVVGMSYFLENEQLIDLLLFHN
jgi:hypothetical protein